MTHSVSLLCALLLIGFARPCSAQDPRVKAPEVESEQPLPPPPVKDEVAPACPSREHVWIPGAYERDPERWVWDEGRWERLPYRSARWQPGRWAHRERHWVWVRGHWTVDDRPGYLVSTRPRIPARLEDARPSSSHAEARWIPGDWEWEGRWTWRPGRWATRPQPRATWLTGHWIQNDQGWLWINAHWAIPRRESGGVSEPHQPNRR